MSPEWPALSSAYGRNPGIAPPTENRAFSGTVVSRAAAATTSPKRALATNAFASQSFTM